MSNELTPEQAFARWIKGEPVEYKHFDAGWRDLAKDWNGLSGPQRDVWTGCAMRIPSAPLTFVDACEKAAETVSGCPSVVTNGRIRVYVDSDGRFWPIRKEDVLTVADLRRTDWRVE